MKTYIRLIPLFLLLAACGFQPVYGVRQDGDVSTSVAAQLNNVAIANIPDRDGQYMRNKLIDAFYRKGRPDSTAYTLTVTLSKTVEDLGIQVDATTTRSRLTMTANYTLTDRAGKKLFASTARSVAGFNKLTQQYSIETARQNATERTLSEISNQIINNIGLYLAENPGSDFQ